MRQLDNKWRKYRRQPNGVCGAAGGNDNGIMAKKRLAAAVIGNGENVPSGVAWRSSGVKSAANK